MRNVVTLVFLFLLFMATAAAQSVAVQPAAEQTSHPSQSFAPDPNPIQPPTELKIPAGTPIEVEVAYTVNSLDVKSGERISFRVLVPIVIDGVTAIDKGALVTARISQAKRGGHWGKAGKLAWSMEDVIATDNSRVVLAPETSSRDDKLWSLEDKNATGVATKGRGSVKGTSHGAEVATMAIVSGALFPPLAPLALIHGFKRGENAILREGRRYVVTVNRETAVKVITAAQHYSSPVGKGASLPLP